MLLIDLEYRHARNACQKKHPKDFLEAIKSGMKKSSIEIKPVNSKHNMKDYVIGCLTFAEYHANWVIATYQPL